MLVSHERTPLVGGDGEPVGRPLSDSVDEGIRHLERLYLELGLLRVQLETSPGTNGTDKRKG